MPTTRTPPRRRRAVPTAPAGLLRCVAAGLLGAGLVGCAVAGPGSSEGPAAAPGGAAGSAGSTAPTAGSPDTLLVSLLDGLERRPRPRGTAGYDRDAFGSAWADTDDNGCNQRDDVLLRDAVPGTTRVQQQGRCDHDVLAGRWVDPYTGADIVLDDLKDPAQAQALQIDHVVPLAEAWVSGAAAWSADRRASYANDLDALLAVDGPTNAAKGADDPAAWRPRAAAQCDYARRWIGTKARWRLAADPSEVRALREMLGRCP